ncbi:hypothetical protein AB1Y20_012106 [Prymnesium parvum]|uniref:Uncharacterized protein n=1 Tax=Prymnesium parvum TaxID=97485 RepID=A0AB34IMK0_PRYPA
MAAALLLSGHLRDACEAGAAALHEQAARCRAAFHATRCDVFLHTWDLHDAATPRPSLACAAALARSLPLAALTVEHQETRLLNMSARWRASPRAYEAFRLNVAGMLGAVELMRLHAAHSRGSYAAAVRLRVDIGSPRVLRLVNGTLPAAAWAAVAAAAAAPPRERQLRACSRTKRPGGAAADNCMWSAPVEPLVATLLALREQFDALSTSTRGCLHAGHPESLVRCAARLAGVVGKPLVGA